MIPPPGYKPAKVKPAQSTDDKPSLLHTAVKGGLIVAGIFGVAAVIGSFGHAANGVSNVTRETREFFPRKGETDEISDEEWEWLEAQERKRKR